jgi:hypothetical protein
MVASDACNEYGILLASVVRMSSWHCVLCLRCKIFRVPIGTCQRMCIIVPNVSSEKTAANA